MLPTIHLGAFLVTVYVLILVPGPSVVFVVSRGVALGRRAALTTVAGNTSGLLVQLALVVIGLGSILASSDVRRDRRALRRVAGRSPRAPRATGSAGRRGAWSA